MHVGLDRFYFHFRNFTFEISYEMRWYYQICTNIRSNCTSGDWFKQLAYNGIILIRGDQCLWIVKSLLVLGDVISWVTGLLHYNARQFITLLNVCKDVNLWVSVAHEIPTNNDDSTVYVYCHLNKILTKPDSLLKRYLHLEQVNGLFIPYVRCQRLS